MESDHTHFMKLALEQAKKSFESGNIPVGSVIVKGGSVVGKGRNEVNSVLDPTLHAEMMATKDACKNMKTKDLMGCTCYTTVEPCPMCCWALMEAGMTQLVIGARFSQVGIKKYGEYTVEKMIAMAGRHLDIVNEVMSAECIALRKMWGI